jgi:hypothetical protein
MESRSDIVRIAARFSGPPDSGNGGYCAGVIAGAIGAAVNVRLVKPVPMDRVLTIASSSHGRWEVQAGAELIATATAHVVQADVPEAPPWVEACGASQHFAGFSQHVFPNCFVCGPAREPGQGLRIFPGLIPGTQVFAAPWRPDRLLDDGSGKIRPEFIWAALDCPGYFASFNPRPALLGELAVHIDRVVRTEEPCVVTAWRIQADGRKCRTGTALFSADGERCAMGVATWIELKAGQ